MNPLVIKNRPTKDQVKQLAGYNGLGLERIKVISKASELCDFSNGILSSPVVGFDTETKPSFEPGSKPNALSLVQVANEQGALLIQLESQCVFNIVSDLISSEEILKVGFGLKQDKQQLYRFFGGQLNNSKDLCTSFSQYGIKQRVGAQAAVALVFGRQLKKSKKVQLSNWANKVLTENQIIYAANDAYSAFDVYARLIATEQ